MITLVAGFCGGCWVTYYFRDQVGETARKIKTWWTKTF